MKPQNPLRILLVLTLVGCTTSNPAMDPVLTFTDGPPPSVSTDEGAREWPDQVEDGSTDDLVHLRVVDGSFPERDATEVEPDVPKPDAFSQDSMEPYPDAEPDAAPPEPDALGLGCLADPEACPVNTVCDGHSRECIPDCFGIICTGATPFCIPPHPPFNVPACGQCLNDYSCAEGWHCNLADQMCNINE